MYITKEIEYVMINGIPSIKHKDFSERETELLEVEFEAHPRREDDGIGSYEYWGSKGYNSRPYVSCETYGIIWDKTKYSEVENQIIDSWLSANYVSLEKSFCSQ